MGALGGLRVVELGGEISAAYATKLLADLGADVVKLEPPDGDPLRRWGPWAADEEHDARRGGGLFRYLNAGKRSAAIDSGSAALLGASDVVVENLGPGRLEDVVPGARPPALVRISDFGQTGPYRDRPASPLTVQAAGGWVSSHGLPGQRPVQVGGRLGEFTAGAFAGCAALTAARIAESGTAVTVDLSVMECLVGTLAYPMLFHVTLEALGLPPPEQRYSVLPGIVRCRDGWCGINALTGQHWQDICVMLDAADWMGAQRQLGYGGPELDRFLSHIQPFLDAHTVEEVVELSQAFRIPAAPVGTGQSLPRLAQFVERAFFVGEADGDAVFPGPPWRLSATPAASAGRAPALVADEGGWEPRPMAPAGAPSRPSPPSPPSLSPLSPAGPASPPAQAARLPLEGVRIVDLGTFWAGPYATLYLGAMGADVIKIESVRRPDGFRFSAAFPEEGDDWYERSGLWQATNLNKRGVTLDLTQPEGQALVRGLIADADVVVENFSPRVVEEFSLGYEVLREIRPDLVMVRMPGFGLAGPWRDYVGWAMGFEQACGMAQVTGDGSRPVNPGGFLDPVVGMHAALVVQAALEHRRRTGQGQLIEIAQVEVGACLTAEQVIEHSLSGRVIGGEGNRSPLYAPQGVYRCAPDPTGAPPWVALSVRGDEEWQALVDALGCPPWALTPALASIEGRHSAHDVIDAGIEVWTGDRTAAEVVAALESVGVPVSMLLGAPGMYRDAQLVGRGYYQAIKHPITGTRHYPGWPMRFSAGLASAHRRTAPTLGQHNDEVLGGMLGLSADELDALRDVGVIGERRET